MRYYVQRGTCESGPYTLGALRRRVDKGEIYFSDEVRRLDSTSWMTVGQLLATNAVPVAAAQVVAAHSDGRAPDLPVERIPPDLHWSIVMLLGFVTFSIFPAAWSIVQAAWVKKIRPQSRALILLVLAVGAGFLARWLHPSIPPSWMEPLFSIVAFILLCCAEVAMVRDLEAYYNSTENIHLRLSGAMVFFFNVFYFQYHMSRIARWKKTGVLQP